MIADEKILIEAGLSEEQALVYGTLLDRGPLKASALSTWVGVKRGLVYKVLEQLEAMNLVEKKGGEGTVALFAPLHPSRLLDIIEARAKSILLTKETLTYSLGSLSSKFNLLSGKPNVQFFEGRDGAIHITQDLPTNSKEILSYMDSEKVTKLLPELNDEHIKQRAKLEIKKRMLITDTDFSITRAKGYNKDMTQAKISTGNTSFPSVIQIYDNKISYLTLSEEKIIGVIIEDKNIADMMRMMFEMNWNQAREII